MGKAEENRAGRATEGGFGDLIALLVDECEWSAVGLPGVLATIPVEGQPADAGHHDQEYADEDRSHHDD